MVSYFAKDSNIIVACRRAIRRIQGGNSSMLIAERICELASLHINRNNNTVADPLLICLHRGVVLPAAHSLRGSIGTCVAR